MNYADVEIRILERQQDGCPVEFRVNDERHYSGGILDLTTEPPRPTDAHYIDAAYGQKLFTWFFADSKLTEQWQAVRSTYPQRRIRFRIDPDEPRLHQVVWESLCEPPHGDHPQLHLAAACRDPLSLATWRFNRSMADRLLDDRFKCWLSHPPKRTSKKSTSATRIQGWP